jgi:alpha-glucosidase
MTYLSIIQKPLLVSLIYLLLSINLFSCAFQQAEPRILKNGQLFKINQLLIGDSYKFSSFRIQWLGDSKENLTLHIEQTTLKQSWSSHAGEAFVSAAYANFETEEFAGSFKVREHTTQQCIEQSIDSWTTEQNGVDIQGTIKCGDQQVPYTLTLTSQNPQQLKLILSFDDSKRINKIGRSELIFSSHAQEQIFGLGEQFSAFNFKNKRVPIMVSEQGLARGKQPLTSILNFFAKGTGGYWYNSYAPIPHFISSDLRSLAIENSEFSILDFRNPKSIHTQTYSNKVNARLIFGKDPLSIIEQYSDISGRMRALPAWSTKGAILGLQGGTQKVLSVVKQIQRADAKVAAVWIQDWQGQRETPLGRRLWWNWELDETRYHDFETFKATLAKDDIRLMAYINPFLIDAEQKPNFKRNLYKEAIKKNYLMRDLEDELVFIDQGSFKAYLIDVSNNDAREWYKSIIKDEMLAKGFSGWMADFGEAMPFDAKPFSGIDAKTLHNEYPTEWAEINREAIDEFAKEQKGKESNDDTLFFMRSAFTRSPGQSTLFWMGDQATTWDNFDGIKTSVTALLTSGMSGFSFNHGDVGGYFSAKLPFNISIGNISEHRTKELMLRWIELGAFQVIFRTHEGLLPERNAQINSDAELIQHFARFTQIYSAWSFYRDQLIQEAATTGVPILRHPFLLYPKEKSFWELSYQQFVIGNELWFAPVLDPNTKTVNILLPEGNWVHAFTGKIYQSEGTTTPLTIYAPIGTPAILYRKGSGIGEQFRNNLFKANLIKDKSL